MIFGWQKLISYATIILSICGIKNKSIKAPDNGLISIQRAHLIIVKCVGS